MSKVLPKELTSYDLVKTFAVVFMIIDHVGFYFFPEDNWLRVLGRMCVPCWFFLIGYAQSRDIGPRLWIGAVLLICGDLVAGLYFFPFNILATMIIIRLLLDPMLARAMRDIRTFWAFNTVLFFLILPSGMIFEYGTHGFILATFGWLVRHKDDLKDKELVHHYMAFAVASFVAIQSLVFGFDQSQFLVLALGILAVTGVLLAFRPAALPKLTALLPRPVVWLLQLTGRRTLEIYVIHLLMFKMAGMYIDPDRFSLLDFHLFYTGTDV